MSVSTGTPTSVLIAARICRPSSMPIPRKLLIDDLFALSKDDLKTKSNPASRARDAHSRAIMVACCCDSITQGPAMMVSRPSPNVAEPTWNDLVISGKRIENYSIKHWELVHCLIDSLVHYLKSRAHE